jgi:hypothetical protein
MIHNFSQKKDVVRVLGLSTIQKCIPTLRTFAYGVFMLDP